MKTHKNRALRTAATSLGNLFLTPWPDNCHGYSMRLIPECQQCFVDICRGYRKMLKLECSASETCSSQCSHGKQSFEMAAQHALPPEYYVSQQSQFLHLDKTYALSNSSQQSQFLNLDKTCSSLRSGLPTQATVPRKLLSTWAGFSSNTGMTKKRRS